MELWNAYLSDGTLTDKILVRDEPIPEGLYHIFCEVLVRHVDGDFLIMKRDRTKPMNPSKWEATVGGCAQLNEDAPTCIRRELFEETGIQSNDIKEISREVHPDALCYYYYCVVDVEKSSVTLQPGETEDYKWLNRREFEAFLCSDDALSGQKQRLKALLLTLE